MPSAHVDVAKRLCAALVNKKQHGPSERDFLPKELKGDWDNWHVNNDPDGVHIRRLNEYTQKSCGFTWDNPTTTTVPSTTAAP
ncbi:MAG: hypothetical protein QOJ09_2656 [Actinomycetota bacterium]|nr:hypothetical protein [Actinomycetota bacterium]